MPPFGGRLILDGSDDYAETSDDPELDIGDEPSESLTVEVWGKFQTLSAAQLISKSDAYELYTEWQGSKNCLWFSLRFTDEIYKVGYCVIGSPVISPSQWHHVAGVYDKAAGKVNLYKDGLLLQQGSRQMAVNNSPNSLKVGVKLAGEVDEVRLSSGARYAGSSYVVPTSPFVCDEQTRALWHFDEVEGATLFHDACGALDNLLTGYNGAHTEGVQAHRLYLPLIVKGY
jgi:hypothetical protein